MKINTQKIFYFIAFVILCTICLQVYWNYKNYLSNTERLKNEVQIAYDKALEIYFDEDSKESFISVFSKDSTVKMENFISVIKKDSFFGKKFEKDKKTDKSNTNLSIEYKEIDNNQKKKESNQFIKAEAIDISRLSSINIVKGRKALDAIGGIQQFPSRITMSFKNDSIKYGKLDSIFNIELNRKNISLNFNFKHIKEDTLFYSYPKKTENFSLKIIPNSSYFKMNETLNLNYDYSKGIVIKRMGSELILSLLFSLAVIGCLFFLLFIIKKQKRIDEIRNDFINNITHEFKTPITTIATALEGISKFNPENDVEKNQKYISMSIKQLQKLEIMVEKILETSTLNANELQLNKESINLVSFIKSIVEKHLEISDKAIEFETENENLNFNGDIFYLENAFSNLIDNAIKYGGNKIKINCYLFEKQIIINIIDNGDSISKSEEKAIFEKFYRIPKGDIHDVKGYGIGLYYAKSIIEKHNGTLELIRTDQTIFKTMLPYET